MADNQIKLGVDLGDSVYQLKELETSLNHVKTATQGVAESYEVLAGAGSNAGVVERRSDAMVSRATEATRAQKLMRQALDDTAPAAARAGTATEKLGKAGEEAAKGTRNLGRATLETGRVVQDFAQGGVAGVLNNVEGLVSALGGGPGLAGVITGVGVAAYVAGPFLKSLWKSLGDGGDAIPLKGLAEMSKRLEEVKTHVEAIKTADAWNLETIQKYNQLLESQASIEKDIAERKKHRSDYEAFMAAPSESDKGRSDELRKDFQKEFAGDGPELQAELMKGLEAAAEFERDQIRRELAGLQAGLRRSQGIGDSRGVSSRKAAIKALEGRLARIGQDINARVTGLISEAAGGVDPVKQKNALDAMQGIVSPATGERLGRVVSGLDPTGGQPVESAEERAERLKADREKAEADRKKADADRAAATREQQQAMTDAQKAVQLQRDAQDKRALQGVAARQFGFDLSDDQAADALKQARDLMGKRVPQVEAGRSAIAGIVREVLQTAQQMNGDQMMQAAEIEAIRMQLQAIQQGQRVTRTRLNRGR